MKGSFDASNAKQVEHLFEEAAAFLAGEFAEQYVNNYKEALINVDEVREAWERTLPNRDTEASGNSGASSVEGNRSFSIENIDGDTMAVTDFSGTPSTQVAAEKYLEGIVGSPEVFARTLDGSTEVYLGEDLPKEYAFSKNSRLSNFFERMAKMKAVTVLDEMILLGENGRWSQNAKDHHGDEAKYGWTRYDTTFGLRTKKAVKVYDAVVLLRNAADGKTYLYDITNVKEKKTVPLDTATQERSAPNNVPAILGAEPSSSNQYTTDTEDVNSDFSITLRPGAEGEQYEYDPNDDPVMQAFFDAYEGAKDWFMEWLKKNFKSTPRD